MYQCIMKLLSFHAVYSWLPKVITTLAQFAQELPPHVRATVRKTIAEFRRTHADAWAIQKSMFTEEELEVRLKDKVLLLYLSVE